MDSAETLASGATHVPLSLLENLIVQYRSTHRNDSSTVAALDDLSRAIKALPLAVSEPLLSDLVCSVPVRPTLRAALGSSGGAQDKTAAAANFLIEAWQARVAASLE